MAEPVFFVALHLHVCFCSVHVHSTVPLKGKLLVSTSSSKLNSRVVNVKTFKFRDARIEKRGALENSYTSIRARIGDSSLEENTHTMFSCVYM